jgi:hypothetical protein
MSSIVLSGPAATKLMQTNGKFLEVASVAKSALVAQTVLCSAGGAGVLAFVDQKGERVQLTAKPFASYGSGDFVIITTGGANAFECVGADRQPVSLVGIPAGSLVP